MTDIVIVNLSPVCDFCSSEGIVVAYLVEDFVLAEYGWGSKGAFAACGMCRDLVEGGRVQDLEDRAFWTFKVVHAPFELPDEIIREFMRRLHREFWVRLRDRIRH